MAKTFVITEHQLHLLLLFATLGLCSSVYYAGKVWSRFARWLDNPPPSEDELD